MTGKTAGDCYCLLNQTVKFKAYYSGHLIEQIIPILWEIPKQDSI